MMDREKARLRGGKLSDASFPSASKFETMSPAADIGDDRRQDIDDRRHILNLNITSRA